MTRVATAAAAVGFVGAGGLLEGNDQQSILLNLRRPERRNVLLQPRIFLL